MKLSGKESILVKALGIIVTAAGLGFFWLEWLVLNGVGAIGAWIADKIGAEGAASNGIVIISYVPAVGLILILAALAALSFLTARWLFRM